MLTLVSVPALAPGKTVIWLQSPPTPRQVSSTSERYFKEHLTPEIQKTSKDRDGCEEKGSDWGSRTISISYSSLGMFSVDFGFHF